jgi:hypothetical protein
LKRLVAATLVLAVACNRVDAAGRIGRVDKALAAQEHAVVALDTRVRALGAMWTDVQTGYESAARRNEAATRGLEEATRAYGVTSQQYRVASEVADRASSRWKLFQKLVIVAAAMDAANLQAAKAQSAADPASLSCDRDMSTSAYRVLLAAQGVALDGMDVDHIVPRSLGGADNPENYQLLPASVNRSLGNTWNEEKCLSVGAERCARAVGVSRKCGGFASLGF